MTTEKAIVQYKGEVITVTFQDVKELICPLATNQEVAIFLKTCQSLNLNPFASEIYLIKYSEGDKAATVIAIDSYLKAGEVNSNYDGHEAGIVLKDSTGKLEFREGSLLLDEETDKLVGGFAKVYRKDRERPFYMAVNKAECIKYRRDGKPTQFWIKEKQPSMLRKTALKRALVEAFPQLFSGAYSTAEFELVPEDQLPPAYQKEGETDWKKWWVRQKEKGLDEEKVHNILGISSLKTDWLEQGRTLEEAEEVINKSLQKSKQTEGQKAVAPTKVKPKQAEWRAFWDRAKQLGLSEGQVHEMLGVTSVKAWTDQGKTLDEAIKVISEKLSQPPKSAQPTEPEGFNIDLTWLKESQKALVWNDNTMLSFIISQYKVSDTSVTGALKKLTREQAEKFVNEINKRLEKQASFL